VAVDQGKFPGRDVQPSGNSVLQAVGSFHVIVFGCRNPSR
jgi:hypothetical protein